MPLSSFTLFLSDVMTDPCAPLGVLERDRLGMPTTPCVFPVIGGFAPLLVCALFEAVVSAAEGEGEGEVGAEPPIPPARPALPAAAGVPPVGGALP